MLVNRDSLDILPVTSVGHGTMSHGTVTEQDFVSDVERFIAEGSHQYNLRLIAAGLNPRQPNLEEAARHWMRNARDRMYYFDPLRLTLVLITQRL